MVAYFYQLDRKSDIQMLFVRLSVFFLLAGVMASCAKDENIHRTSLILKNGINYTSTMEEVPLGGTITIGILASGAGVPLTYLHIERIIGTDTLVQIDKGIYMGSEGLDEDFTFVKDTALIETWRVLVMNADRDTASQILKVRRGSGSDWGDINSYENLELSMQDHIAGNWYLDLDKGIVFNSIWVAGHESEIDIMAYYYVTSGLPSPSLTCPGYTSAVGYYPQILQWTDKQVTLFDYNTSDNNLISTEQFDHALNDSLLVSAYQPDKVSGNCKYCNTSKVIPFKTAKGKYGMIKVLNADHESTGQMTISVKIQK